MTTKHWTHQYAAMLQEGATMVVTATSEERKEIAKAICTFYHNHESEPRPDGPYGQEMVHAIHYETEHGKAEIKITFRLLWRFAQRKKLVEQTTEIPELPL